MLKIFNLILLIFLACSCGDDDTPAGAATPTIISEVDSTCDGESCIR